MTLKIGISGIRGITGETLTDKLVSDFTKAFATYIGKGTVIVGRDSRPSGVSLEKIVISALTDAGINVLYVGVCPTPTVQFLVKNIRSQGGMIITASHNPAEWNGIKFTSGKGLFLNAKQNDRLIKIFSSKRFKLMSKKGSIKILNEPYDQHINAILKKVDTLNIKNKHFKVVMDSCNGAGSIASIKLLERLGCIVIPLYSNPDEGFPRGAEPVADNLRALCDKVKETNADIGFAQDPDADRLAIVTDDGIAIGEEYSLVLAAKYLLSNKRGRNIPAIVTNVSTSMMVDEIANRYGAKVLRTKVGEINVIEKILKTKGSFGGEGNGGIIYPQIVPTRDSLTGIALVLSLMYKENKKISEIISDIPKYNMIKTKINCSSKHEIKTLLKHLKDKYKGENISLLDGVKIIFKDSWLHVRPSNTEPVVRVIAEGKNRERAEELISSINS